MSPVEDEAVSVVETLREFELTDDEIADGAIESSPGTTDPVAAIREHARTYPSSADGDSLADLFGDSDESADHVTGNEAAIVHDVLSASPRGIRSDWKYSAETAEWHLSSVAGQFGHDIEFRPVAGGPLTSSDPGTHPQAFRIARTDPDGDEASFAFRYPPCEGYPTLNYHALVEVVNRELLCPVGVRLGKLVVNRGDHYHWFALETDRLRDLQDRYGERLTVSGDPLLETGPFLDEALADYDSACALDHETAYGVPEPSDIVKLETFSTDAEYGDR